MNKVDNSIIHQPDVDIPEGDADGAPQAMSGAVVTPVAAKRRDVRVDVLEPFDEHQHISKKVAAKAKAARASMDSVGESRPASEAGSVIGEAAQFDGATAVEGDTPGENRKNTMHDAVAFDVGESEKEEQSDEGDNCVCGPHHRKKKGEPDQESQHEGIPGVDDRMSFMAMVDAPAIFMLRPSKPRKKNGVPALEGPASAACKGLCRKGGKCARSNGQGCGDAFCDSEPSSEAPDV